MSNYSTSVRAYDEDYVYAQQVKYHSQVVLICYFSLSLICAFVHCLLDLECLAKIMK